MQTPHTCRLDELNFNQTFAAVMLLHVLHEVAECDVALTFPPMEHCHLGSVASQRWPVPA
jgi:hypothetical protein